MEKHEEIVEVASSPIILNKKGEILLVKSPKWGDQYLIPGGHIETGETIFEAACREGEEETGLKLKPLYCINAEELIFSPSFHRRAHFVCFHIVCEAITEDVKIDGVEIIDYLWIHPEKAIKELSLTQGIEETLKNLIENKKFNIETFNFNY